MELTLINKLISHWEKDNLVISTINANSLDSILKGNDILLPSDFKSLYIQANGLYDCDHEGFLFYPVEDLITMGNKFSLNKKSELHQIVLFADYLQQSWWYGFKMIDSKNYEIGIIESSQDYRKITNSLSQFIEFYLQDSSSLYPD